MKLYWIFCFSAINVLAVMGMVMFSINYIVDKGWSDTKAFFLWLCPSILIAGSWFYWLIVFLVRLEEVT